MQDELTLAMAELGDVRKYHNDALARLREAGRGVVQTSAGCSGGRGAEGHAQAPQQRTVTALVNWGEVTGRVIGTVQQPWRS